MWVFRRWKDRVVTTGNGNGNGNCDDKGIGNHSRRVVSVAIVDNLKMKHE